MIAGRDWLFDGNAYYIDTSHVASVVQLSPDLEDPETLRLILGLTEYGRRLAPMYQFPGQPPFEHVYQDYASYIKTVLGSEVEEGIEHFRRKARPTPGPTGPPTPPWRWSTCSPASSATTKRSTFLQRTSPSSRPRELGCPPMLHLCQMAGTWNACAKSSRQRGDLFSFAAGALQE